MIFDEQSTDALVEKLERDRCNEVEVQFQELGMSKAELELFKEARDEVKDEIEMAARTDNYDPGSLHVSGGVEGAPTYTREFYMLLHCHARSDHFEWRSH